MGLLFEIVLFIVDQLPWKMSNMLQGAKIKTPRESYLQCLDKEYPKTSIPIFYYTFSMDTRKKAAQATIKEFVKPTLTLVFKKSYNYSDSDTSSCEGQNASNSKSPNPASLRDFINALPNFELLHFGFYLSNDDKMPNCLCPCAKGVT